MARGRPKEFDRDSVLEKAMTLFWQRGYSPTGLTELTRHMGIGRQSLYDTFGDKKSLYLAALEHYGQAQLAQMIGQLEAPGPALDNIRAVFESWREHSSTGASCGCMMANALAEFGEDDPQVAAFVDRKMRRIEAAFFATYERALAEGELADEAQPRILARMTLAVAQGMAMLDKSPLGAEMLDDVIAGLELLMSGCRASPIRIDEGAN